MWLSVPTGALGAGRQVLRADIPYRWQARFLTCFISPFLTSFLTHHGDGLIVADLVVVSHSGVSAFVVGHLYGKVNRDRLRSVRVSRSK